jgi:hypothetical protein
LSFQKIYEKIEKDISEKICIVRLNTSWDLWIVYIYIKDNRWEMAGLLHLNTVKKLFNIIKMNFFSLLSVTKTRNTMILSFTDHLSK